jgi:hypothetical protein
MLIGVVGALLGGFLAGGLFGADPLGGFFELSTWVTAVAGSIVLLLYRVLPDAAGPCDGRPPNLGPLSNSSHRRFC